MPGIIQVSVLEFKGLPSSSSSSPSKVSIKVSKGKLEYQTWDKGEFSFPLTTLRDNLIITIQDAEGNEVSHTGIETRLVVEKGVWDDIFSFEGCGEVHMKLQFVLSDDERQRIRIMRESALKKKQEELRNSGHGCPENASIMNCEVSGSQESSFGSGTNEACQVSVSLNKLKDAPKMLRDSGLGSPENASVSNTEVSGSQGRSLQSGLQAKEASQATVPLNNLKNELEKHNNSKKPGPAGKARSNVKNMISAFEGSLNQDLRPPIKPPPKISQMRKIGSVDSFLEKSYLKEVETEKIIPSKLTLGTFNREKIKTFGSVEPKETEQLKESTAACNQTERKVSDLKNRFKFKERESVVKEEKKHSKDFERASSIEKSVFSQRKLDKYSRGKQSWNLSSAKQHSGRKSITKEGGEEISRRDRREAEGNSNGKLWYGDHCSIGGSGLWIFPGEVKGLCITTGNKRIIDLMGGLCHPKNTGEVKDAGTAIVANEDGKTSMAPEESIGPFGQVIKVAVMVGFATFVLLTGKRTYRLNHLPV